MSVLSRPAWNNKVWTDDEDNLVMSLPPMETAEQIGRSLAAVYQRRRKLRTHRAAGNHDQGEEHHPKDSNAP